MSNSAQAMPSVPQIWKNPATEELEDAPLTEVSSSLTLGILNDRQQSLNHPHILQCECSNEDTLLHDNRGETNQVSDLFELIRSLKVLPTFLSRTYARQIVDAVAYLHEKGIAHADLRLENILLDKECQLKLACSGSSCCTLTQQRLTSLAAANAYFAPEQYNSSFYSQFDSDVFALGIIIFVLVAGMFPFQEATDDDELYSCFINNDSDKFWYLHNGIRGVNPAKSFYKENFKDLINKIFCYDSSKRISIEEVRAHPWFKELCLTDEAAKDMLIEVLKKKNCKI
jgi:serine/threonine protein kinase